jgi:hypothetical protein
MADGFEYMLGLIFFVGAGLTLMGRLSPIDLAILCGATLVVAKYQTLI